MIKMTFEFVVIEPQGRQIRKVPQGFRDAPCVKLDEKWVGQWGATSPKNDKNGPESWFSERYKSLKFARLPKNAGMLPA